MAMPDEDSGRVSCHPPVFLDYHTVCFYPRHRIFANTWVLAGASSRNMLIRRPQNQKCGEVRRQTRNRSSSLQPALRGPGMAPWNRCSDTGRHHRQLRGTSWHKVQVYLTTDKIVWTRDLHSFLFSFAKLLVSDLFDFDLHWLQHCLESAVFAWICLSNWVPK
jgi:hypothetical protein